MTSVQCGAIARSVHSNELSDIWRPVLAKHPYGTRSTRSRTHYFREKDRGEWKRTIQLYNVRNQIAHGILLSERIDVSSETQHFYRIQWLARE